MKDLAVYVHVPFCLQRCSYCHFEVKIFHPRTNPAPFVNRYLTALEQETNHVASTFSGRTVASIFFGGGTPSRLEPAHIRRCLQFLAAAFSLASDCEISMEANPEDVDPQRLAAYREAGINRISFGVQSFDDRVLKAVNRAHDGQSAFSVIKNSPRFPNGVSLDLMLGLPFQDKDVLARDLERIVELGPEHVSLYMLERDLPTPLDKQRGFHPNEDLQADFYEMTCDFLDAHGYKHYEISNFALPGKHCRHNLVYWRCGDYLGLGPAAHGRIGLSYYANHERLSDWQAMVAEKGHGVSFREEWSVERYRQEQIVQGLRLSDGISMELLVGNERKYVKDWVGSGLAVVDEDCLKLTRKGRLLGNEIFAAFVES